MNEQWTARLSAFLIYRQQLLRAEHKTIRRVKDDIVGWLLYILLQAIAIIGAITTPSPEEGADFLLLIVVNLFIALLIILFVSLFTSVIKEYNFGYIFTISMLIIVMPAPDQGDTLFIALSCIVGGWTTHAFVQALAEGTAQSLKATVQRLLIALFLTPLHIFFRATDFWILKHPDHPLLGTPAAAILEP